jgi:hypothetical protein
MFPALVRYDECARGMVEHACRIVVARSRMQYLYPATHYASTTPSSQTNVPAMGQRLRLKSGFVIPAAWAKEERALLSGLKKYGALVADNGGFFSISITPDDRWPATAFSHIPSISITNFEVVQSTGPNEGPRAPGAPVADAGPDQTARPGQTIALPGVVRFSGAEPNVTWTQYSGPGGATLLNPAQTNTLATFNTPGSYTLLLAAADNVHAVAYDALVITVSTSPVLSAAPAGPNQLGLTWTGGSPPFVVESVPGLPATTWSGVVTTSQQNATVPLTGASGFFRVLAR